MSVCCLQQRAHSRWKTAAQTLYIAYLYEQGFHKNNDKIFSGWTGESSASQKKHSLFQTYNMKSNNNEFSLSKCVQSFYSA